MGTKLYVGGLPYSVTEGRLQEIFSAHGTVESANVIADKFTGQSRGFGFVEMSSGSEAQKAISSLNGTQLDGRTLTVNEAKPMARRDDGGGRGNRQGGRNRWQILRFLAKAFGVAGRVAPSHLPRLRRRGNPSAWHLHGSPEGANQFIASPFA